MYPTAPVTRPLPVTRRVPAPPGPRLTRRLPLPLPGRRLCATLLLAPLVGVALWAAMRGYPSPSPAVYTVAALTERLASKHTAWIGRTVWVRGDVVTRLNRLYQSNGVAGMGFIMQMYLVDPVGPGSILFMDGPPNPVYATLRSLPLLGRLPPSPQAPHMDVLADYQVQLQIVPCAGGRHTCDAAVLLDANPA